MTTIIKKVLLVFLLLLGVQANAKVRDSVEIRSDFLADSLFRAQTLRQHFFYGYTFDIFYHHDSQDRQRTNGWSLSVMPEFGYKINTRTQVGLRFGGSFSLQRLGYTYWDLEGKEINEDLVVRGGSWEVTPYMRYRLKTLFNGAVGIWLDLHAYTGMEFPVIQEGNPVGTEYERLRHSIYYGVQIAPLITYQFNKKSTFNLFISIMSLGYSGCTRVYNDEEGKRRNEYNNDLLLFSGRLSNLLSSQFMFGMYGIKFGVQKNF